MRSPVPSASNRTFVEYRSIRKGAVAFALGFAAGDFCVAAACARDVRGATKSKVMLVAKQIAANEIFVDDAEGMRCK